jgi:glycosyltransferase involved in cell wall biosynthesis
MARPKVAVVMPAYNAARTLVSTYDAIPKDFVDELILVDDASHDDTVSIARGLGLVVVVHERNRGYGGNQKTCYREALRRGAEIVVMLHPDFQYDPSDIPRLLKPLIQGEADVVFGSRMLRGAVGRGGMPGWKVIGNRFLTLVENVALGQRLSEYHSGYRAFTAGVLRSIPYHRNNDGFVFDQEIIVQLVERGFRIKEVPVSSKYFDDMSSVNFKTSLEYGLRTLTLMGRVVILRWRHKPACTPG